MATLLSKVKANLILEHDADDELLQQYIAAAVSYAESYQHLTAGTYEAAVMPPTTEQAVIMLALTFTRAGTAARAVSSRTMCRRVSRPGLL
jgi:hypothetical protein